MEFNRCVYGKALGYNYHYAVYPKKTYDPQMETGEGVGAQLVHYWLVIGPSWDTVDY